MKPLYIIVSVTTVLVVSYFITLPDLTVDTERMSAEPSEEMHALSVSCPPDIYASSYLSYLEASDQKMETRLEPLLYGSQKDLAELTEDISSVLVSSQGITLIFTAEPFDQLFAAPCEEGCSPSAYQSLASICYDTLGSRCYDFAVVIDGAAQCLMMPKGGLPYD